MTARVPSPRPVAFTLIAISMGMVTTNPAGASGPDRTVNDGFFTVQQADRGAEIYAEHCVTCHGANMRGSPGAPGVSGPEFQFLWDGKTVGELYESVRTKMPPGKAGMLSDQDYIDVIAAILKGNGFPPRENEELPADSERLDKMLVDWCE